MGNKGTVHLILPILILIILGMVAGVYLVKNKNPLIFRSKATNNATRLEFIGPSVVDGKAISEDIKVKLTYTPVSSTPSRSSVTQLGMQIDTNDFAKVPNADQLRALNPSWVRFVYRPSKAMPSLTSEVKQLVIFNNESAEPAPISSEDGSVWRNYTDNVYVPALENFIKSNPNIDAVEIWNEEDYCAGDAYCPRVPASSFAYMLKKAAATIKSQNPSIKVIMGGLVSGQPSYVADVKNAESNVFDQVDAIGIHPYGKSPDNWCSSVPSANNICEGSILPLCNQGNGFLQVKWNLKNEYGGNSCNIYINNGQGDYQINGTNNAGPCAGSQIITSVGGQSIQPNARYRLFLSNGNPTGGCYNNLKGDVVFQCDSCSGDLQFTCGAAGYPENRLRAAWNLPQVYGENSCNIYIRGGTKDYVISNSCNGSWEGNRLPGDDLYITNDGIYQLYVSNGDPKGGCYNQMRGESRLNCSICAASLPFGDLTTAISAIKDIVPGKDVWVSEVGASSSNREWQAEYLRRMYASLQAQGVPVFIWYAWIDTMTGASGETDFGLVTSSRELKTVGHAFATLTASSNSRLVYPSHFRVANSMQGLESEPEQVFSQGKEIDWRLVSGNGTKTVFAQFKVDGVWSSPISNEINLAIPHATTPSTTAAPVSTTVSKPTKRCAQVITPAKNPQTGQCMEFPTPCDVPADWEKVDSCLDYSPTPKPFVFTCSPCAADINKDKQVNLIDFSILSSCYNKKITATEKNNCERADINKDQKVDGSDLTCLRSVYGKKCN